MRVPFLFFVLLLAVAALARAGSIGTVEPQGLLGADLLVEYKNGTRADHVYFEQRLLAFNRIWVGGKPGQPGAKRLSPQAAAQCKMALRRAIYDEVGVSVADGWATAAPDRFKDERAYWLHRLYRHVSSRGRPALTEALANDLLSRPVLSNAVAVLDEADVVRDPSPDSPAEILYIWADRVDEYRAIEMRASCDRDGNILRILLSGYLIKNPPLTAADIERVRQNGTFGFAEEVFGPDSNYVPLSRNNGGAALWETVLDGLRVEITVVVDGEGRLTRLVVSPPSRDN